MARKFNELRNKMRPEARKKAHDAALKYEAEMALDELREARQMTQEHLASLLRVKQPAIAKMERRTDLYLSTLQSIVKAMGGRLVIKAVFPEGSIEINQLRAFRQNAKKPGTRRKGTRSQAKQTARRPVNTERRSKERRPAVA